MRRGERRNKWGSRYHVFRVFGVEGYGAGAVTLDVLFDKSHLCLVGECGMLRVVENKVLLCEA